MVADDAAICPKCDAVVDMSLLDNKPPEADGPTEPRAKPIAGGMKKKRPVTSASGSAPAVRRSVNSPDPRPSGSKPAVKRAGGGPGMPDAPVRKVREKVAPTEDWHVKDEPRVPAAQRAGLSNNQMMDPEDFWGELKHFVLDLSMADKLAFLGSVAALISCFFPWKDTITEGEILGLMSLGAAVFGVSVLIIVAIVIRVRKVMPALHALIPWLIQFGGACFCIVWCLVYVKLSWDSTMARSPIGNFERWVSSPSPGVFIALLMSVMTLGGTLMGLKEKPGR
jgi:hypothetical protein